MSFLEFSSAFPDQASVIPLFVITELDQDIITTFTHDDDDIRADNHEQDNIMASFISQRATDAFLPSFVCGLLVPPSPKATNGRSQIRHS
jgi:hypothetical protein